MPVVVAGWRDIFLELKRGDSILTSLSMKDWIWWEKMTDRFWVGLFARLSERLFSLA